MIADLRLLYLTYVLGAATTLLANRPGERGRD